MITALFYFCKKKSVVNKFIDFFRKLDTLFAIL